MKKSLFSTEQIIGAINEVSAGAKVTDVCRKLGISEVTFYRWKAKYGGMSVPDARRLKELEAENRRLKQMVAEQALDLQAMKAVISKKW